MTFLPEDLTARIDEAADNAIGAFFVSVASDFPEIRSGDLDPLAIEAFNRAATEVVRAWVAANDPDAAYDDTTDPLSATYDDTDNDALYDASREA